MLSKAPEMEQQKGCPPGGLSRAHSIRFAQCARGREIGQIRKREQVVTIFRNGSNNGYLTHFYFFFVSGCCGWAAPQPRSVRHECRATELPAGEEAAGEVEQDD